jgi:hypothetical protein
MCIAFLGPDKYDVQLLLDHRLLPIKTSASHHAVCNATLFTLTAAAADIELMYTVTEKRTHLVQVPAAVVLALILACAIHA